MRQTHGQSSYTPIKQRHLQMFLDGGVHGWTTLLKKNRRSGLAVIDATAGSGYTQEGEAGSPIILNRHFQQKFPGRFRQLCCDRDKGNIEKLQQIELSACELVRGQYEDTVLPWLQTLPFQPVFGLLYVDVNGFKEAINGFDLFEKLRQSNQFMRIDLAINMSLNGYKRHYGVIESKYNGQPPEWLTVPLIEHMDRLTSFKLKNFIRTELDALQEWVMTYGVHTEKVSYTRRNAGIIPYAEWRENAQFYLNGGRKVSHNQLRMDQIL